MMKLKKSVKIIKNKKNYQLPGYVGKFIKPVIRIT